MQSIASRLLRWFDVHGRRDLPWQRSRTPYLVWVSEVMLQQTQVVTAIAYFERFVQALPSLRALADADEDRVFALWSGLGYYRRARNLHRAAKFCVEHHGGELPCDFDELCSLPGIGRSTAGAILALAHNDRCAILDGNVKRVLARYHGVHGNPGERAVEQRLWKFAEQHTPRSRVADYTQAIMDLGATVCTSSSPRCHECPLSANCIAHNESLTDVLPQRRTRHAIPLRNIVMLLLRDARGRILLQRRGPNGVWSGLWSLPEAEHTDAAHVVAARLASIDHAEAATLPPFLHTFTHYRLAAQPVLWRNARAHRAIADDADLRWCAPDEFAQLGLPAPVRKLLHDLNREQNR